MDEKDISFLYSNCTLCPRLCHTNRLQKGQGFCKQTVDIKMASACLHFGEEPVLVGEQGSGTVFFSGCTLGCSFCQNYQISCKNKDKALLGKTISIEDFSKICLLLQQKGAQNINLITGTQFAPAIVAGLEQAKKNGLALPICWNTSGYETIQTLQMLKSVVDIWLPDLKTLDENLAKELFLCPSYPEAAKDAICWMLDNSTKKIIKQKTKQGKDFEVMLSGVIIRHLFLPNHFQDTANVLDFLKKTADGKALISLMTQYTPIKNAKKSFNLPSRFVNEQEAKDLKDLTDAYDFEYLFFQELQTGDDWLPDFSKRQPFSNKLATPIWHYTDT